MLISGRTLAVACASMLLGACAPDTVVDQPDDVTGRWVTDAPTYVDRGFEITEDRLYLLQGGNAYSMHVILSIDRGHDDLPLYTIEYLGDEGDVYSFRFYFSEEAGGTILFPNQEQMKWRRDPDAVVPWVLPPGSERP